MSIKFLWGIFCKRFIFDSQTSTPSIIDVLLSLKTEKSISSVLIEEKLAKFNITTDLSYVFSFQKTADTRELSSLVFVFKLPNDTELKTEADLDFKEDKESCFVNFNFNNLPCSVPASPGIYTKDYSVDIFYEENLITSLNIPITIHLLGDEDEPI